MMKKNRLGIIALVMAMVVLQGAWGSGSRAAPSTAGTVTVDRSNFNAVGAFPVVKQKATINVMYALTSAEINPDTNWMTKFMEEKTGVHVNWITVPGEQYKEKVNLALASGDQIDFVVGGEHNWTNFTATEILKYASQDLILPIQDYIEQDSVWFKQRLSAYDGWRDVITLPNGNIYVTPSANECYHCMYYGKLWVNQEFLKNLNLAIPTTPAEFHDMLVAFKNQDANGNGDPNDEIPMMGAIDSFGSRVDTFLMSAFIYDDGDNRLLIENGKVTAAYTQPQFQEGLRYLHQLYTEGLISRESFTASRDTRQKLNSAKYESIIGVIPNIHHGNMGSRESDQPARWIDYEPITPLKGPNGTQVTRFDYYAKFRVSGGGFIPATCKNPALVIRWLDWLLSDEGTMMLMFGDKGMGWTDADTGATGPSGLKATYNLISMPRTDPYYGNASWGAVFPNFRTEAFRLAQQVPEDMRDPEGTGSERLLYVKSRENYAPYAQTINKLVPPLYYSTDDISEMAMLTTNINTYVEESIAKFIVGDLNVETGWTAFQNNLKNLGIDKYLSIIQKTYNASSFAK
jgi:putative aldouronate transport system substrate-binding protein